SVWRCWREASGGLDEFPASSCCPRTTKRTSQGAVVSTSVLVTGGAGFIGSHVSEAYVRAGYHVTVLDDLSRGRRENVPRAAEFIHADIRSLEARRLAASGRFSLVNHHAAQIDVRRSMRDPQADAAVNLDGFLNILEGV